MRRFFGLSSLSKWSLNSMNFSAASSSFFSCSQRIVATRCGHSVFFRQDMMNLIDPQDFNLIVLFLRTYITAFLNSMGPRSLRSPLICRTRQKIRSISVPPSMLSFPSYQSRTKQQSMIHVPIKSYMSAGSCLLSRATTEPVAAGIFGTSEREHAKLVK